MGDRLSAIELSDSQPEAIRIRKARSTIASKRSFAPIPAQITVLPLPIPGRLGHQTFIDQFLFSRDVNPRH